MRIGTGGTLGLLLALGACGGAQQRAELKPVEARLPGMRLSEAVAKAAREPRDALQAARAGWLEYLVGADPARARAYFLQASREGAAPAVRQLALLGLGELEEDGLDGQAAVRAWVSALAVDPAAPLTELCALRLLDAEGDSEPVDDQVLVAARLFDQGGNPRAARTLREAAARVLHARALRAPDGPARERAQWAALGVVQEWRVAGPLARLRLRDLGLPTALDGPASAPARALGPAGPVSERSLTFPDGDVGLELEPQEGDLFVAVSDLAVAQGGPYLATVEGASALEVRLDDAVVIARTPWPREMPRAQTVPVALGAGGHRVLVRWSRAEGARFRFSLVRADGRPSDVRSSAPLAVAGARTSAPCALGRPCLAAPAWADSGSMWAQADRLLEADAGDPLGAFLHARATLAEDKNAARRDVERLVNVTAAGAPALVMRAGFALRDPEIPDRLARAQALVDLRRATAVVPLFLRARLTAAALQRDSERLDDAAQELAAAQEAAGGKPPARLLLAQARLADQQGNPTAQRRLASQALALEPGRCDARLMLFELARREGGLAEQERLAPEVRGCVEARGALTAFLKERDRIGEAEELQRALLDLRPAQLQRLWALSELRLARKDAPGALALLRRATELSPRSPEPWRRLAQTLDFLGDVAGAREARLQQLRRAPGELRLRRQLAQEGGGALLGWTARDGVALAKEPDGSWRPAGGERPAALRLLDYGAAEFFEDGSAVERSHTVARLLDKKGIARFGEAQVPADAEILELRTLKADGRILEPEAIPNKDSVSLPGLEPGDSIEIDYLRAWPARGPDLPGVALGSFFFKDDETPMRESTFEVRAPRALALEVDAHNLKIAPVEERPDGKRWVHTERDVAPRPPEPGQPSEPEIGPWVQVGWGEGTPALVAQLADWVVLRARPSSTLEALVLAAGGATPLERVERIVTATAQAVRGRASQVDFGTPAAHVLRAGRGNRLLVLQAALQTAGLRARLVLVRPFSADPAAYRFVHGELLGAAVLRVELPDRTLWLDPSFRLMPVGGLPPALRGREAWVLPQPGEAPLRVETPTEGPVGGEGRSLTFRLDLEASGRARGTGLDELRGFEAAALREVLERLDLDQRRQAVEAMLGRALRGVALESLRAEGETSQGGPARLLYELRAPLGRRDGEDLLVPASLSPAQLSRRWLQKLERTQPLLIDGNERVDSRVELTLPAGFVAARLPAPVKLVAPLAEYRWEAHVEAGKLVVEEALVLSEQRIQTAGYPAFVAFARAVDRAQEQELRLVPSGKLARGGGD